MKTLYVTLLLQSMYKKDGPQEETPIHKIRITLTSRNVKSLEKGEPFTSQEVLRDLHTLFVTTFTHTHTHSLSLSLSYYYIHTQFVMI